MTENSTNKSRCKLGFAMCGSFCTHETAIGVLQSLAINYDVVPILSFTAAETDTRFGRASELYQKICGICGREPIMTIREAEVLGPSSPLDMLLICPCTGNTLAKLACGITDTPVTMAAKAHLRCDRPTVIALASNDSMSANFSNIGTMLNRKNVYFVPMRQDDPLSKPHSLVADFGLCAASIDSAVSGVQLRPLFR